MLFRKDVEPCCAYCVHGSYIDDESVICVKKGVMKSWGKCRRFEYDPLKRQPEAPSKPLTKGFKEEDFEI